MWPTFGLCPPFWLRACAPPTDYDKHKDMDCSLAAGSQPVTSLNSIADGDSCAAKCVETYGCSLAAFTAGNCYLWNGGCSSYYGSSYYGRPNVDIYIMLPAGPCPDGTTSNGTACNPTCTVANCEFCVPGSASMCAECGMGYTLSSGQCSVLGEHGRPRMQRATTGRGRLCLGPAR